MNKPAPSRAGVRVGGLVAVVAALFLAGQYLPVTDYLEGLRGWIAELGSAGPVAFIAIYIAATVLALPGTPLTVVSAALFGSVYGVIYISIASTLGATAAFLISRYIARDAVSDWLGERPQFQRIERLTANNAGLVVAITRLVPLFPFNLLNYGFGLTNVALWPYVFWSWLCMLPGTVLYVVGVDTIITAVQAGTISPPAIGAVAAALVLLIVLGRLGRRKLAALDPDPQATPVSTTPGTER